MADPRYIVLTRFKRDRQFSQIIGASSLEDARARALDFVTDTVYEVMEASVYEERDDAPESEPGSFKLDRYWRDRGRVKHERHQRPLLYGGTNRVRPSALTITP
jgi:hypothetical protein